MFNAVKSELCILKPGLDLRSYSSYEMVSNSQINSSLHNNSKTIENISLTVILKLYNYGFSRLHWLNQLIILKTLYRLKGWVVTNPVGWGVWQRHRKSWRLLEACRASWECRSQSSCVLLLGWRSKECCMSPWDLQEERVTKELTSRHGVKRKQFTEAVRLVRSTAGSKDPMWSAKAAVRVIGGNYGECGETVRSQGTVYYIRELIVLLWHGLHIHTLVPGTCRLVV